VLSALIWYYTEINDLEERQFHVEKVEKNRHRNMSGTLRNAGIA